MALLSADPRVTRSSRSWTAVSSCAAGATWLTSPQSSAVRASMTSPDMARSMALPADVPGHGHHRGVAEPAALAAGRGEAGVLTGHGEVGAGDQLAAGRRGQPLD